VELFKGSRPAIDPLFPENLVARVDSMAGSSLRPADLRRRLALLSRRRSADYVGNGAVCAFYSTRFMSSLLTEGGDGVAVSVAPEGAQYSVSVCVVNDSVPPSHAFSGQLRNQDLLLVRLRVGGVPNVLTLRVATLPRERLQHEQQEFKKGAAQIAGKASEALFPSQPKERVGHCLNEASAANDAEKRR
jgi:hypothetical protein